MWAMLQAAGAVLAKFGAKHPAVKWGVIALVGLFAVELIYERGLYLYKTTMTVGPEITKTTSDSIKALQDACIAQQSLGYATNPPACAQLNGQPIVTLEMAKAKEAAEIAARPSEEETRQAELKIVYASQIITAPDGRRVYALPFIDGKAGTLALPDRNATTAQKNTYESKTTLEGFAAHPEYWITAKE